MYSYALYDAVRTRELAGGGGGGGGWPPGGGGGGKGGGGGGGGGGGSVALWFPDIHYLSLI